MLTFRASTQTPRAMTPASGVGIVEADSGLLAHVMGRRVAVLNGSVSAETGRIRRHPRRHRAGCPAQRRTGASFFVILLFSRDDALLYSARGLILQTPPAASAAWSLSRQVLRLSHSQRGRRRTGVNLLRLAYAVIATNEEPSAKE